MNIIPDAQNVGTLLDASSQTSSYILQLILHYKYIVLVPLTMFQGPIVMLGTGFLLQLGVVDFWPAYLALMIGDLIGDTFWYAVGYYLGEPFVRRFGKYVSITPAHIEAVRRLFHRYHNRILIISKVTMGFGFALVTLIAAGISKIPFKKYIALNAVGQLFWTALLLGAGFSLGRFYESAASVLGHVTSFGLLVILFVCLFGFAKYMKKKIATEYIQ